MPDYSGHMSHDEYVQRLRQRLIALAHAVLDGKLGAVEGCTLIWPTLCELGLFFEEDEAVGEIRMVDSDSDRFAFGDTRKLWAAELLATRDEELSEYEQWARDRVDVACRQIIDRYEQAWTCSDVTAEDT